jgi:uncharacterized DUF497 family protein
MKIMFCDPLAVTISDDDRVAEVRWITMGKDRHGQYVLVIHTFEQLDDKTARIRVISARRPTKTEARDYEEHQ